MSKFSNTIELVVKKNSERIIKRIHFDRYNGEEELITVFKPDGTRTSADDVGMYEPAEYHINIDKVFEKYYVEREELNDFEKLLAMIYFTKFDDLKKIAGDDEDLVKILKQRKELANSLELLDEYFSQFDIGQKKDFD